METSLRQPLTASEPPSSSSSRCASRAGRALEWVLWALFLLSTFPWCLGLVGMRVVPQFCPATGARNRKASMALVMCTFGGIANAVLSRVLVASTFGEVQALRPLYPAFFTWALTTFMLVVSCERTMLADDGEGGAAGAQQRGDRFIVRLLKLFDTEVTAAHCPPSCVDMSYLFLLAAIAPALVSGYVVEFFVSDKLELQCSLSGSVCDVKTVNGCCRIVAGRGFFEFIAFTSANALAGFKIVQGLAQFILGQNYVRTPSAETGE